MVICMQNETSNVRFVLVKISPHFVDYNRAFGKRELIQFFNFSISLQLSPRQQRRGRKSSAAQADANQPPAAHRLRRHVEADAAVQPGRQESRLDEKESAGLCSVVRAKQRCQSGREGIRRTGRRAGFFERRRGEQPRAAGWKSFLAVQRSFPRYQMVRHRRHREEFPRSRNGWRYKLFKPVKKLTFDTFCRRRRWTAVAAITTSAR